MKLLLDECATRHLKRDFSGHEVYTVEDAGFKGLENGELLKAASGVYVFSVSTSNFDEPRSVPTIH